MEEKNKNDVPTYHDFSEHCDFCVLSFQSRPELKAHVLKHFDKKTCLKTQKTLLLIAGDWFELHINQGCTSERCDSEITSTNNVEYDQSVKQEDNDSENSMNNDVLLCVKTNSVTRENGSEFEFNCDANSSECSSASSEKKVRKFESRATRTKSKKTKVDRILTPPNKRMRRRSTTKKMTQTPNRQTLTCKPVLPKSKSTKCRICKQNFAQEALLLHLQLRHAPKIDPIPTCETCGKTFSTPGNLRSHQYLHAERGRYICSYCGKVFVRNANLKEHINLHTGARPFVCDVCKKTFHRETLLRNHRRIHTGEKKYRCNIENCERAYMFDIDLKRHKFSVHGIYSKKHPCFICSKIFSENKLLKKHLEAH